ncbi:hypothetical protein [Portibacter marinus]|uniref:hypothetical protein n=1 Tax=Portibacter marinus TaxID=2898660 RepID=UPI001F3E767C|nr:hypothetical protein [Portibacter marinus]
MFKGLTNIGIILLLCLAISCEEELVDHEMEEEEIEIPEANVLLANGGCPDTLIPFYLEKDGQLMIEMESADYDATSWTLDSVLSGASNDKYLVWKGSNHYSDPGKGLLNFRIRIENPGTYRFLWRSRITQGNSNTDFNDSWLRIPNADHFYGKRDSDGHIVYPKGTNQDPIVDSEGQAHTMPEGAGKDGWFKIYMNRLGSWAWISRTSDNDPHQIFAIFDEAGDYTIQIAGRSTNHGIDKLTMFLTHIPQNTATATNVLSDALCE